MATTLSRRDLLRAAASIGLIGAVRKGSDARVIAQTRSLYVDYPFSLGVASGDPVPDGVVLWTRLAPSPLEGGGMPLAPIEVGWDVSRDRQFRTIDTQGTAIARPEVGHSVHVEVSGLDAGREYFYRFRTSNDVSQVGRTRTAPAAGAPVDALRFAVCSCANYEEGLYTAYRHIADANFDFVFFNGDYIYEYRQDNGRRDRLPRQHHRNETYTLVDYRNRYAQYKMDDDLRAAHQSAPWIVTPDDHEVSDNFAGNIDRFDSPPEVFAFRRAAAYQAYYEHMPIRASAMPRGNTMRIYRRVMFGNLVDLHVLDTRQWRSDHTCGGSNVRATCDDAGNAQRTMFGPEQEQWLFENLATARARWTLIGQQVPTFARNVPAPDTNAPRYAMDAWDGYTAARDRLYARIRDTRASNPVVLSGDVHQHHAADLKLNFADPKSQTVAVELTNTSISSGGDGSDVSADWARVKAANPHIKYHSNRRGYIACTATPARFLSEFRIVERVIVPDQPVKTGASFVVEAGRAGLLPA